MSRRQGLLVMSGLLTTCGLAVVVLLTLFYSTVSGAVERAARHRSEAAVSARATVAEARPQARSISVLASSVD